MSDRVIIPTKFKVGDIIQFDNMYVSYTLVEGSCKDCCFYNNNEGYSSCELCDSGEWVEYLVKICNLDTCFKENKQTVNEIPTEFEIGSLVSFKSDNRIFRVEKRTELGCEDCCFNVNDSCMSENHNVAVGYLAVLCNKNNCIYKELKEE